MAHEWFVEHGGKEQGPFTSANLKKLATDGKITPATSVRLGQTGAWVPASRVQGLFSETQLGVVPPAARPTASPPPAATRSAAPQVAVPPVNPPVVPPPVAPPRAVAPAAAPRAAASAPPALAPASVVLPRRVAKAVPTQARPLAPRLIGAIAIILGAVALATCWLPILGGAVGWTGIVVGALGLVLGIAGLVVASIHKGDGLLWSVGGAGSSAVGLVLATVLGIAFGLFAGAPPPKQAAVVPSPILPVETPPPVIPPPAEPEPEPPPEPVWTLAGQAIEQGEIRASLSTIRVEPVRLESADLSMMRTQKPKPMLKIKVAIENISTDKIIPVIGWPGGGDAVSQGLGQILGGEAAKLAQATSTSATLSDNINNKYPQTPAMMVFGAPQVDLGQNASVRPGNKKEVDLIFEPPLATIEYLRLELPPAGFAGGDSLRFQIPREMIEGL